MEPIQIGPQDIAKIQNQQERVDTAFSYIKAASYLLTSLPYASYADSLESQIAQIPIHNPHLLGIGKQRDLRRKLRSLRAAAAFAAEMIEIQEEIAADRAAVLNSQELPHGS